MKVSSQQHDGILGIKYRRAYEEVERSARTSTTPSTGFRVYSKEDCGRLAWFVLNLIGKKVQIDGQTYIYGRKSLFGCAERIEIEGHKSLAVDAKKFVQQLDQIFKKMQATPSKTEAFMETEQVEVTSTPAPIKPEETKAFMDIDNVEVTLVSMEIEQEKVTVTPAPQKPEVKTSVSMDTEKEVVEVRSAFMEVEGQVVELKSAFMEVENEVTNLTPAPQVGQPEDAAASRPATPLVDVGYYSHEDIDSSSSVSEDEEELDPRDIAMDRIDTLGEAINWNAKPTPLKYALTRTYNTVKGTDNHPQFINDLRTLGYHISRGEVVAQRIN